MGKELNKIALVTGASNGIGFHTALELAHHGCKVYALSRDAKRLDVLSSQNDIKGEIIPIVFDLEQDDPKSLPGQIDLKDRGLDIIVHNAGYLKSAPFEELKEKDWMHIYKVNVFAPATLSALFIPYMGKAEKGHIIHISSIGGIQGSVKFPGLSAYSSSKGALCILTECMAEELKERNIAVNCLALGAVQTKMLSDAFPGYKAPMGPEKMGSYIADFALNGQEFFNGKIIPLSLSTP